MHNQPQQKGFPNEAEVVLAEELRAVLFRLIAEHEAFYEQHYLGGNTKPFTMIGPMQWFAQDIDLTRRNIQKALNSNQKYIGLSTADKILSGLELTHLLVTEIRVIPNPSWSQERWMKYMTERGCMD